MATKTIQLPNIPKNSWMSWSIASQAAFNICVTLQDSSKVYVNNQCRASTSFGYISQGYAQVAGTGMNMVISISSSDNIQTVLIPYSVPNPSGLNVGQGYNLLLEDSNDQDFNDLFVSIIAWQANG
ncbi:MAG: hypothetical protein SF066_03540 [Thermoanaerobaculia bacterium]|nr:hypothetical protein [Thermoanaerobaculia bacterium]